MKSKFRHVALIGKYQTVASGVSSASSRRVLEDIAHFLNAQGCEVVFEQDTARNMGITGYPVADVAAIGANCDLGLVVGGDGTMLGIGRQLAKFGVPLIGVNQGRLGFITDIPLDGYASALAPMLRGEYEEDHRSLMHARVMRDGRCVYDALAMNDVVVNRAATSGMVELRVEVDGHFVANQRADGLIIATPTGSTAYNLAAGGPIVQPNVDAIIVNPIAPHTLTNRPIVIPSDAAVRVQPVMDDRDEVFVTFDGQTGFDLEARDEVRVCRAEAPLRLLKPSTRSYFEVLRQKLKWGER